MQFLVIFSNKAHFVTEGLPDDFAARFEEDGAYLRRLYEQDVIRQVWTIDTPEKGGVVLFEIGSRDELERLLAEVPFVKADYNDYRVLPLGPYPAFVRSGSV